MISVHQRHQTLQAFRCRLAVARAPHICFCVVCALTGRVALDNCDDVDGPNKESM